MKHLLLVLLLCISYGSVSAQEIPKWSLADLKSAMEKAENPIVINFWATFCKPCIAEMPHFQQLANQYKSKGVDFVFVSLDSPSEYPKRVQTFVNRLKITSPVAYLAESDADLFCPAVDASWSGAIPATLLLNPKSGYRKFLEEEIDKSQLEKLILEMIR